MVNRIYHVKNGKAAKKVTRNCRILQWATLCSSKKYNVKLVANWQSTESSTKLWRPYVKNTQTIHDQMLELSGECIEIWSYKWLVLSNTKITFNSSHIPQLLNLNLNSVQHDSVCQSSDTSRLLRFTFELIQLTQTSRSPSHEWIISCFSKNMPVFSCFLLIQAVKRNF